MFLIGVPHAVSEEDIVTGYRIQKGTTVLANYEVIDHDKEEFENPDRFEHKPWLKNLKMPQIAFS